MAEKVKEKEQDLDGATGDLLVPYLKASYPVLYLLTPEEGRAEREIMAAGPQTKRDNIVLWSCTQGLVPLKGGQKDEEAKQPVAALTKILSEEKEGFIYVFRDLHLHFQNPSVVRLIRDIASAFKQGKRTLILVSPVNKITPEIERDVTLIEFELPNRENLNYVWSKIATRNKITENETEVERIVEAARGLTTVECENAVSKALVDRVKMQKRNELDKTVVIPQLSEIVMKEKAMTVKKTGILEYFDIKEIPDNIGGLQPLKQWLDMRKLAFSKEAREFGLPAPRGYVLVGLPGCGKSLSAKATACIMNVPLIRFDVSRVFAGLVGQSEHNMRTAINTVEAIGNCVVWVDEMEKAFAGAGQSQSGDSGVTQRVFGIFLTWMQEKKSPSFIVATVNRILGLPPELLRKGRFDEIFFVDLPDESEREEIMKIHVRKRRDAKFLQEMMKDGAWKDCIKASEGYSGAEIEEAIISGLYTAFHRGSKNGKREDLKMDYVYSSLLNTTPVSRSQQESLKSMLEWAKTNAVRANERAGEKKISRDKGEAQVRQLDLDE